MLLYLIALIALAGATIAQDENECQTKYRCYTPKRCNENTLLVRETEPVNPACFVVLKIHPYTSNWFRIVLESVESTNKIALEQQDSDTQAVKPLVICEKDGDKVRALYDGTEVPKLIDSSVAGKFKCEFEIDLRSNTRAVPTGLSLYNVRAVVFDGNTQKKTDFISVVAPLFCLPSSIVTSQDALASDKYYTKVKYELGTFLCDHPIYTKEFRAEGSEDYKPLDNLYCNKGSGTFTVVFGGSTIPKNIPRDDDIDVRCVADAEYFCDYDPKNTADQKALERLKPDIDSNNPRKGTIQCNASHPFFVINGQRPIKNAEIKCKNHRGKMKWTFIDHSSPSLAETILSENGPKVHCVDMFECHVMNRLNASNLKGSFLNAEFFPTCQDGGTLKVHEGTSTERDVVNVLCDGTTGIYNYLYRYGGTNLTGTVTQATVFSCFYEDKGTEANEKTDKQMIFIGIGIFCGTFLLSLGITAGVAVISTRQSKNEQNGASDAQKEARTNDELDLLANDYLQKKSKDAQRDVQFAIIPEEIAVPIRERAESKAEVEKKNVNMRENDEIEKILPEENEIRNKIMYELHSAGKSSAEKANKMKTH